MELHGKGVGVRGALHGPGVHFQERVQDAPGVALSGVPLFVGFAQVLRRATGRLRTLTRRQQFRQELGGMPADGYLEQAVEGFFVNGGQRCVVYPLEPDEVGATVLLEAFREGGPLEEGADVEQADLVCVPDLMLPPLRESSSMVFHLQSRVLDYCQRLGGRFALLDALPAEPAQALTQWQELLPTDGALYFPWIGLSGPVPRAVPPCGHVAGVYARTDRLVGVHKAPANAVLAGVVDLQWRLAEDELARLNAAGVNCLHSLPGRGIRVWGARTLSGQPAWRYVNVRRLFLDLARRAEYGMRDLVFEPNGPALWKRIRDRLRAHCLGLYRRGALKGRSPTEAYFVKCDEETTTNTDRNAGRVIVEVGLAAELPAEFVVVRLVRNAAGDTRLMG
jgi:phage tail sheath protein FI